MREVAMTLHNLSEEIHNSAKATTANIKFVHVPSQPFFEEYITVVG